MTAMQIHALQQGTPEWHAHRAQYHNASDAPAMMGASPYKTRSALLREKATGISPDVDAATQALFDKGHEAEALARPIAEAIVGEDLFPVTGTRGNLGASLDGLTIDDAIVWEHKLLNESIRQAIGHDGATGADLPLHYQIQMQQQMLVSSADKALFTASRWDSETCAEILHVWLDADPAMQAKITAGWEQFDRDVASYTTEPVQAKPVAAPVEGFGALTLRVEGRVLASNMDKFKADAEAFIARLPKPADLQTDQDFANAEAAVKACTEAEARIKAATEAALAQMADVDAVLRTADHIAETIRQARLALDKVVKAEKENRKAEIVRQASEQLQRHIDGINASMGEYAIAYPAYVQSRLAQAIKGKKTLNSIADAAAAELAELKIECSTQADNRRPGIAMVAAIAPEHAGLFADRVQLVSTYSARELERIIAARIAEHQQAETARQEAERERIRQEEAARIEREQAQAQEQAQPVTVEAPAAAPAMIENTPPGQSISLGQINEAITPFRISGDGLAELGFHPVAQKGSAKLYRASDWQAMQAAFVRSMQAAKFGAAK